MSAMKIVMLTILLVANVFSSRANDDLQGYFDPEFNNFDQSYDDWVQDWYRFLSQSDAIFVACKPFFREALKLGHK